jgi:hypothetical protein
MNVLVIELTKLPEKPSWVAAVGQRKLKLVEAAAA